MKHELKTVLAEKESAFKMQYEVASAHVSAAPEADQFWGDTNATLVAAIHVARAASLAIDVIALRKALRMNWSSA